MLSLATNTVSDRIFTPGAFHVVKVIGRVPSEQTPSDQMQAQIKKGLDLEESNKQLPAFQGQIFSETGVEILLPGTRTR